MQILTSPCQHRTFEQTPLLNPTVLNSSLYFSTRQPAASPKKRRFRMLTWQKFYTEIYMETKVRLQQLVHAVTKISRRANVMWTQATTKYCRLECSSGSLILLTLYSKIKSIFDWAQEFKKYLKEKRNDRCPPD